MNRYVLLAAGALIGAASALPARSQSDPYPASDYRALDPLDPSAQTFPDRRRPYAPDHEAREPLHDAGTSRDSAGRPTHGAPGTGSMDRAAAQAYGGATPRDRLSPRGYGFRPGSD